MPPMTLYYFPIPGRAETARLILTLGKIDFIDKRIPFDEWHEWKPKMPFGQVPVLEVDGKMLAQMAAIDHYCAAITGMLPEDPLKLAEADMVSCFLEDVWQPLGTAMSLRNNPTATEDAKKKVFDELLQHDSTFKQRLSQLEKVVASREGKFLGGDKLTHADLAVFITLSTFQSGWLSGLPRDILSGYPALKAFRQLVASVPDVAAFYDKEEDEVRKAGFRPDAAAEPAAAGHA